MGRFPHDERYDQIACGCDHHGYLPEFVIISDGKTTDIEAERTLAFPKGSIVAYDRGYDDYGRYNQLTQKGNFFVTRFMKNAQ